MTRTLLVRGLLVGLAAGFVAFVVAYLVGEPSVAAAIAVEEGGQAHHAGEAGDVAIVSRSVQSTIGLLTALLLYGAAIGGMFGLACAVAQGRLGAVGARATAGIVALVGFVVVNLVPFLKYPANPPAVGQPDTIGRRTGLYFAVVLLSILATVVAVLVARQIHRWSTWDRVLGGIAIYLALMAVVILVMPQIHEVGADFPATTLWSFRIGSIATQLATWATLGLLFGGLTERAARRQRATVAPRPTPVPTSAG